MFKRLSKFLGLAKRVSTLAEAHAKAEDSLSQSEGHNGFPDAAEEPSEVTEDIPEPAKELPVVRDESKLGKILDQRRAWSIKPRDFPEYIGLLRQAIIDVNTLFIPIDMVETENGKRPEARLRMSLDGFPLAYFINSHLAKSLSEEFSGLFTECHATFAYSPRDGGSTLLDLSLRYQHGLQKGDEPRGILLPKDERLNLSMELKVQLVGYFGFIIDLFESEVFSQALLEDDIDTARSEIDKSVATIIERKSEYFHNELYAPSARGLRMKYYIDQGDPENIRLEDFPLYVGLLEDVINQIKDTRIPIECEERKNGDIFTHGGMQVNLQRTELTDFVMNHINRSVNTGLRASFPRNCKLSFTRCVDESGESTSLVGIGASSLVPVGDEGQVRKVVDRDREMDNLGSVLDIEVMEYIGCMINAFKSEQFASAVKDGNARSAELELESAFKDRYRGMF